MLSIVIPVKNEAQNVAPLLAEFKVLSEHVPVREVIYVDDGSTDDTRDALLRAQADYPFLRVISHDHNAGQSAALWTGINAAKDGLVATIDGDGQNNPADLEALYECFMAHAEDASPVMVMGQRVKRQDNALRRLSSRVANVVRASMLRDGTRDTGCGLKLFRRSDYMKLPYFDHMHRFLPALVRRLGGTVQSIDVQHRPRQRGKSKYGLHNRLWVGIVDLLGVWWLQRRRFRPDVTEPG
jgi:dolichol-phosphate mannosyltransferase